jgi:hypothetical protein
LSIVDDIIPEGYEPPEEETEEAPAEAPLASPEAEAPLANETSETAEVETPAQPDPWAAYREDPRFASYIDEAGGDPGKILERLHGLRQQLSRGQQEPQPAAPAEPELLMADDIIWPPENIKELYQAAQNPEFAGHAAIWAMENRHRLPQNVLNEVVNNWWYTNPAQAQAYQTQQLLDEREARQKQQWEPIQQHTANSISTTAQTLAAQAIDKRVAGDWDKYKPQIAMLCQDEQNAKWFFRFGEDTPEKLKQGLVEAYGYIKYQEWMAQGGQGPAPVPQEAAQPAQQAAEPPRDEHGRFAATTTGRGSAPSRNTTKDEDIVNAIIGV